MPERLKRADADELPETLGDGDERAEFDARAESVMPDADAECELDMLDDGEPVEETLPDTDAATENDERGRVGETVGDLDEATEREPESENDGDETGETDGELEIEPVLDGTADLDGDIDPLDVRVIETVADTETDAKADLDTLGDSDAE